LQNQVENLNHCKEQNISPLIKKRFYFTEGRKYIVRKNISKEM